jgi:hypothetical protein
MGGCWLEARGASGRREREVQHWLQGKKQKAGWGWGGRRSRFGDGSGRDEVRAGCALEETKCLEDKGGWELPALITC